MDRSTETKTIHITLEFTTYSNNEPHTPVSVFARSSHVNTPSAPEPVAAPGESPLVSEGLARTRPSTANL
jgi:hypothetical protein